MFDFLKRPTSPAGGSHDQAISRPSETITLQLSGLHCTSCALNIDGTLEDTPGVIESNTSYAKSTTTITFDPAQINPNQIKKIIEATGYQVT